MSGALVAMAASTALPPLLRTSRPIAVAGACGDETMPCITRTGRKPARAARVHSARAEATLRVAGSYPTRSALPLWSWPLVVMAGPVL
jgi:hypothetical protein